MQQKLSPHWPRGLPTTLHVPDITLYNNLQISAKKYPDKTATIFYGAELDYARLKEHVDALAGYLQQHCGVRKGDRIALMTQNCPQYIIAAYAIWRAEAVLVQVNPMLRTNEVEFYLRDSGARVAIVASELAGEITPFLDNHSLDNLLIFDYADYLSHAADIDIPAWLGRQSKRPTGAAVHDFKTAIELHCAPNPYRGKPDDLALLPYTSGTTGHPKGCCHTHRTLMSSIQASILWRNLNAETVVLASPPMFHMLGFQAVMNNPISIGATMVILPRWDPAVAAMLIERYRITYLGTTPTMIISLMAYLEEHPLDISSINFLGGGGAIMPEGLSNLLKNQYDLELLEAYGLTETASFTLANPTNNPKKSCLGLATFDVECLLLATDGSNRILDKGEAGELAICGNQVMLGYWNNPEANRDAFITIEGKRFFRTGDIATCDDEGYYFIQDRLKRMINASGYKVWPAELESEISNHEAIQEVCIIGVPDERRGETVKAVVVLRPSFKGTTQEDQIIHWCRDRMAAYKVPRFIEFVDELPRSSTGKVQWRQLQEQAIAAATAAPAIHSATINAAQ